MARTVYCEAVWRTKVVDGVEVERWREPLGVFEPDESRLFVAAPRDHGYGVVTFQALYLTGEGLRVQYSPSVSWYGADFHTLVDAETAKTWLCANGHEVVTAELFPEVSA